MMAITTRSSINVNATRRISGEILRTNIPGILLLRDQVEASQPAVPVGEFE
jgi:hypothetical protein